MSNTIKSNSIKASTITQLTLISSAIILAALLLTSQPSQAYNAESSSRRGPPPQAYTACENKSEGEAAQFENHQGEVLSGSCEIVGGENAGKLVLRPTYRQGQHASKQVSNNQQNKSKRRGPPAEAFTACEGKAAGEAAQFENRRGETLKGTCKEAKQNSTLLVLRPDRFKN